MTHPDPSKMSEQEIKAYAEKLVRDNDTGRTIEDAVAEANAIDPRTP